MKIPQRTTRFGVSLDDKLRRRFDSAIARKGYANRSEAIRDLIREALVEEEWDDQEQETVATLTLIYDHDTHELSERLTDLQHTFHKQVVSTVHVHLDAHNCLEVLILRGKSGEIRRHADLLSSIKGVKHGKLAMSSTGKRL
jgi:CopG family nickel-responsive transcriptional regulator